MERLPKSTGPFAIGVMQLEFIDETRKQVFSFEEPDKARKVPILIYYPCEGQVGYQQDTYVSLEEALHIKKHYKFLISKKISNINAYAYKNAPISKTLDKYPVVMYNHGLGAFMQNNTILLNELTSKGYVVISVGHPYEAGIVKFLDGELIAMRLDYEFPKETKEIKQKYIELNTSKIKSDDDALRLEKEYYELLHPNLHQHISIWEQDCRFILNQLERMNDGQIESMFKGKLDFGQGVGIMGHSYGGSTAGQVCWNDKRFSCGINIDCFNYGEYGFKNIQTPFLMIGANHIKRFGKSVYVMNSEDSYMITINRTKHLSFTDLAYIAPKMRFLGITGKKKKEEVTHILTTYISKFLDRYLKMNLESNILDTSFPEVELSYNKS